MQELGLDDKNKNDASSQMTQEEKDMAYFEKRYQQRVRVTFFIRSSFYYIKRSNLRVYEIKAKFRKFYIVLSGKKSFTSANS